MSQQTPLQLVSFKHFFKGPSPPQPATSLRSCTGHWGRSICWISRPLGPPTRWPCVRTISALFRWWFQWSHGPSPCGRKTGSGQGNFGPQPDVEQMLELWMKQKSRPFRLFQILDIKHDHSKWSKCWDTRSGKRLHRCGKTMWKPARKMICISWNGFHISFMLVYWKVSISVWYHRIHLAHDMQYQDDTKETCLISTFCWICVQELFITCWIGSLNWNDSVL